MSVFRKDDHPFSGVTSGGDVASLTKSLPLITEIPTYYHLGLNASDKALQRFYLHTAQGGLIRGNPMVVIMRTCPNSSLTIIWFTLPSSYSLLNSAKFSLATYRGVWQRLIRRGARHLFEQGRNDVAAGSIPARGFLPEL